MGGPNDHPVFWV